jgi:hypothetical protein
MARLLTTVPKTAINENGNSYLRENEIRLAE